MKKDKLFEKNKKIKDFEFDRKVASVFDDMVSRSVPMYRESMDASISLADTFVSKNSRVYDIGCSTGTLLMNCCQQFEEKNVKFIGIDSSEHMLKQAKKKISKNRLTKKVTLIKQNIEDNLSIEDATIVFMNYTLQFLRPLNRQQVLERIFKGMKRNSAFIMIEKILGNNSLFNRVYIDLYFKYKTSVGYSDSEIKNKREALENVLIPYRLDENIQLLKNSGFSSVDVFFKWFNWCGIVAIKE